MELNVGYEMIKLLEKIYKKIFVNVGLGQDFLKWTKKQILNVTKNKYKITNFCSLEDVIKKPKSKFTNWEKYVYNIYI